MPHLKVTTNNDFELYTNKRQLRDRKNLMQFVTALKEIVKPASLRIWHGQRGCWMITGHQFIKPLKNLTEIYFKDSWTTEDTRRTVNPNDLARMLQMSPTANPDAVMFIYRAVRNYCHMFNSETIPELDITLSELNLFAQHGQERTDRPPKADSSNQQ
jgi:hypothetical protein